MTKNSGQGRPRSVVGAFPPKSGKSFRAAGTIRIEHPEEFQRVVRRILKRVRIRLSQGAVDGEDKRSRRGRGRPRLPASSQAVADYLELSRETIKRLEEGRLSRIGLATYRRLMEVAQKDSCHLRSGVLSKATRARLQKANDRLAEAFEDEGSSLGLPLAIRIRLRKLMRKKGFRKTVTGFIRLLESHGHSPFRRREAFRAVLSPLSRFQTTCGIERGFHELKKDELANFVAAGLRWQMVLLKRDADEARAQSTAQQPPEANFELGDVSPEYSWDFLEGERLWALSELRADFDIQPPRSERPPRPRRAV